MFCDLVGSTPLWEQAKAGEGQVVLLSGEPGIGKSRLVQTLKEQALAEGATRIEFRCSPYHQNSALYPIIEHLQRLLQFTSQDPPQAKLTSLQQTLTQYRFPQADTLPVLAALLSLPPPEGAPPLTLSPQKQKQKTQEALVAWISEEAELYRLKGELTLQSTGQSRETRGKEAEECFYKAIAIARRQQAKSWELRAATGLAQLWQRQGKEAEARQMLADIYGWFTEGFDTKDLQEAQALLDALSQES